MLPRRAPLRTLLSRDAIIVALALAVAAALAWSWLLRSPEGAGAMHDVGMIPEPFSAEYLLPAFAMWAIMMVAMMVPSAAPMILLHARIDKVQSRAARRVHTALFALGYLAVWAAFSAAAALAQATLVHSGLMSAATLSLGSRTLSAALVLVTAMYELTAAKRICLDKCQAPLMFMARYFRPGAAGAVRLGIFHGVYCLGCCWVLMLLLFVAGVMNLAWVALLAIVIFGEKFAPPHWHAERYVAAALAIAAGAILIAS